MQTVIIRLDVRDILAFYEGQLDAAVANGVHLSKAQRRDVFAALDGKVVVQLHGPADPNRVINGIAVRGGEKSVGIGVASGGSGGVGGGATGSLPGDNDDDLGELFLTGKQWNKMLLVQWPVAPRVRRPVRAAPSSPPPSSSTSSSSPSSSSLSDDAPPIPQPKVLGVPIPLAVVDKIQTGAFGQPGGPSSVPSSSSGGGGGPGGPGGSATGGPSGGDSLASIPGVEEADAMEAAAYDGVPTNPEDNSSSIFASLVCLMGIAFVIYMMTSPRGGPGGAGVGVRSAVYDGGDIGRR